MIKLTFNQARQFNQLNKLLLLCISGLTHQGDLFIELGKNRHADLQPILHVNHFAIYH